MAHDCNDCEGTRKFGLTRRDWLRNSMGGFLGFALAKQAEVFGVAMPDLLLPQDTTTRAAKSVIVVWLAGGPATLDLWDPKEGRDTGGPTKAIETSVKGIQYADNLPTIAKVANATYSQGGSDIGCLVKATNGKDRRSRIAIQSSGSAVCP